MPTRPLHPCPAPGCSNLVGSGYCRDHQRSREQYRGTAHSRGYDRAHTRRRRLVLNRDPICRGCDHAASVVDDHIIRIQDGGSKTDMMNQQGLCSDCHGYKITAEQADPTFGTRLRTLGERNGEPAPRGWRHHPAFQRGA